jgi:hypothetical protein
VIVPVKNKRLVVTAAILAVCGLCAAAYLSFVWDLCHDAEMSMALEAKEFQCSVGRWPKSDAEMLARSRSVFKRIYHDVYDPNRLHLAVEVAKDGKVTGVFTGSWPWRFEHRWPDLRTLPGCDGQSTDDFW